MYEHDVFLSYKRNAFWQPFVEHLHRELHGLLRAKRPSGGGVYLDVRERRFGSPWPERLAAELASSRLFVPVIWPEYFNEDDSWCRAELSQFLNRQELHPAEDMIFPIVFLEPALPTELGRREPLDLDDLASPHLQPQTPDAQALFRRLRPFVDDLTLAAQLVPDYDPAWKNLATDRFERLFSRRVPIQSELVGVGGGIR